MGVTGDSIMEKRTLQRWGQAMIGINFIALLKFNLAVAAVPATILTIAEIASGEISTLPPVIQFALTLAGYMIATATVVVILAGIFKAVTYCVGLALVKLDDFIFRERPAKIKLKGRLVELGERTEIYIDVKNRHLLPIENVIPVIHFEVPAEAGYMSFQESLKWRGIKNGTVQIRGLKSKQIHLGTVREDGHTMIHLEKHGSHLVDIGKNGLNFTITISTKFANSPEKKSKNFDLSLYYKNEKLYVKITDSQSNKIRHFNETDKD